MITIFSANLPSFIKKIAITMKDIHVLNIGVLFFKLKYKKKQD